MRGSKKEKEKKKATSLISSKGKGRIVKLRKRKQSFDSESTPGFLFPLSLFSAFWLGKTHRYLKTKNKKKVKKSRRVGKATTWKTVRYEL